MKRKRVFCRESLCVTCCSGGPLKINGRERESADLHRGKGVHNFRSFDFFMFCFCRLRCRGVREDEREIERGERDKEKKKP